MSHQEVPRVPQQSIPSRSLPGDLNETLDYMDYEEPVGHTPVAGALTSFDVFAFVVNKEVGTGIFTAPSLVLALAGSREMAIVLWAVGFGYSVIGSSTYLLQFTYADVGPSMLLYLSFAAVLPYNTGELLYGDEVTSYDGAANNDFPQRSTQKAPFILRHLGNGLFAYTVYAILFVTLFNSGTNSLQVGRQILLCYEPHDGDPNQNVMRLIAMIALSIVCLIHYFSARAGRKANRWFCVLKLAILLILLGKSMKRAIVGPKLGFPQLSGESEGFSKYAQALLLVVFSFQGWENASFVAGEIPSTGHNTLRNGFLWAVTVVGALYLLLNITYVFSVETHGLTPGNDAATSFAPQMFGYSTGAIKCWAVLTAISAMGSLISIVYTFSRVKQSIGAANILPHSDLWKQDSPEHGDCPVHKHEAHLINKTPKGGLIMHCVSTVVIIWAVIGVHDVMGMVTSPGFIHTYAHCLVDVFLTLGLPTLHGRAQALERANAGFKWIWAPEGICSKGLISLTFLLYASCSLFIIATFPLTPYSEMMRNWVVPATVGSVLLLGTLYYFIVFWASAKDDDSHQHSLRASDQDLGYPMSILSLAGVKCVIKKASVFDTEHDKRARRFGSRRSITYKRINQGDNSPLRLLLYWGFGGRVDVSPLERAELMWDASKQLVAYWFYLLFRRRVIDDESSHQNLSIAEAETSGIGTVGARS